MRLVQPVVEAARDLREVAAREAERQRRGARDVEGRRRPAAPRAGAPRAPRSSARDRAGRRPPPPGRTGGSITVTSPFAQITKLPYSDAATLSGWPSTRAACCISSSRSSASSYMWSAATSPATIAAPLDPRPASSGISERILKLRPSIACSSENARTQRLVSSAGRRASPASTEKLPVSSTSSSRCSDTAAAIASKPGPRFADEPGTRTRRRRPISRAPRARPRRSRGRRR